ncbi:DUF397 domain-containing protein [Streptomyces sp. NBC_00059]|uniref:DUF397 domain-containing protein n=1 Tax=Streptomyces sp. NBC_00059 TaxID=2975635 RepID=UPI00225AC167|nr:DUF397 domain-containing protein [Streptomyces sp. NBC_00059]MCX5413024.1 DUF397 domain-containing protein [Streptomyces sp. NBC_00059]
MTDKPSVEDTREPVWFKSSYSDSSSGNDCVEVAPTPRTVHVRDSKCTAGPLLGFAPATWTAFVAYASRR